MAIPEDLKEPLMDVSEVAFVLGCKEDKVRYTLAGNEIPYILVGSNKMFEPQIIRNYKINNTKFYGDKRKLKGVS